MPGTKLETLALEPGYYRFELNSEELYECPLGEAACPGSAALNGTESAGEALCGEDYEGMLCSKCR